MAHQENLFTDRTSPPTRGQVQKALGKRCAYWEELIRHVPEIAEEWKYYGPRIGWTKKLLLGKRNLCFLVVTPGAFAAAFVFGDRAVAAVERSTLPASLVEDLVRARRYAEGRGIRIEVKSLRALKNAKLLIDIKREF